MLVKSRQAAAQGAALSTTLIPSRLVASVPARRRPAAFSSVSRAARLRVCASAEPESPAPAAAPAPAARGPRGARAAPREVTVNLEDVSAGDVFTGVVSAVEAYGAFVDFGAEKQGLVHISQLKNGYVASAASVVSVGDEVEVRVLSVDAASGKIALTMKGVSDEDGEDAGVDGPEEENDADASASAEGLVYVDDFKFPFVVEDEGEELSQEAINALADATDLEIEHSTDLDLPLNELIHGKVTKVDAYGAFIMVTHNGKDVEAYLDRDEAKVPSSALSPEDLLEFVGEGEAVPDYIDIVGQEILYEDDEDEDAKDQTDSRFMFDDMSQYYKVGDEVQAFVLGFDSRKDLMALTHFTDYEVQGDSLDVLQDALLEEDDEEDEGEGGFRRDRRDGRKDSGRGRQDDDTTEEDTVPLSRLGLAEDFDPLAFSPEQLMDMADDDATNDFTAADDDLEGDVSEAVREYRVYNRGALGFVKGRKGRGLRAADVAFPDRAADSIDPFALQNVVRVDTDFDGDEIVLEDIWQDSGLEVSDAAWKKLGLKIQFDEYGECEVVPREAPVEGAAAAEEEVVMEDEDDLMVAANSDHAARVKSWVEMLLEEDEDEAELPALAMRKPLS